MNYISLFSSGLLLLLQIASSAHGEVISHNLVVKHSDIQVLANYSEQKETGLIRIKSCSSCEEQELILDSDSILLFKGQQLGMNVLLYTRLRYPSKQVRVQYNQRDNTVSYIRWSANAEQEKGLL